MADQAEENKQSVDHSREFALKLMQAKPRLSSFQVAVETVNCLRRVIVSKKFDTVAELLSILEDAGKKIRKMAPHEYVVGNVLLMVCKSVRDEHTRLERGGADPLPAYDSLHRLWTSDDDTKKQPATGKNLRKCVIAGVKELVTELEASRDGIGEKAQEYVNRSDVLLLHSLAHSESMRAFVADGPRNIIAVDCAIDNNHEQISLADVAMCMRRVSKVILASAAVFPDGSCLVPAGGLSIAIAASRHSVPVIVLASIYKLTPRYPHGTPNVTGAPCVPFSVASSNSFAPYVNVISPELELLPAKLVSLFVSSSFAHSPNHIYRLMSDYFHPDDTAILDS